MSRSLGYPFLTLVCFALLVAGSRLVRAQEVPAARQATILARALGYDNNLKERAGDSLTVVVVYGGEEESRRQGAAIGVAMRELQKLTLQGLRFKVVEASFTSAKALEERISAEGVDAIYVCTGLGNELGAIQALAEKRRILTLAGHKGYMERGLVLGVFMRDGSPAIYLNLPASKRVGAAFSSDLIRLASVIP